MLLCLCANLTVIDMMVDPDGTLDALSNLGMTSPLTEQNINPGTQQGALVLHRGVVASSSAISPSRPEGRATEPSDRAEKTE